MYSTAIKSVYFTKRKERKVTIMGNNTFKLTKLALAIGLTATLSGCFSDNDDNDYVKPPEPPVPTVKAPVADTPAALTFYVAGNVVNSQTGDVVPSKITFSEAVVDLDGAAITEIDSTDGSFSFNVADGVDSVTAVVSAAGFVSQNTIIDTSSKGGPIEEIVLLASEAALLTVSQGVKATAGKLDEDLTVATENDSAKVAIPSSVELRDAAGAAITGSDVTVKVVTAPLNPAEGKAAAVDLIPAGLNSNSTTEVVSPAAVINIAMNAGDTKIKSFDGDITITASLPKDFVNKNGDTVKKDDVFGVSTFNEDTGVWANENITATVGDEGTVTFPVEYKIDHLSTHLITESKTACASNVTLNLTGDALPAGGIWVGFESQSLRFFRYVTSTTQTIIPQAIAAKFGLSTTDKGDFFVFDNNGNDWADVEDVTICGEVAAVLNNPVEVVNEEFALTYSCSNAEVDQDKQFPLTGALVKYSLAGKISATAKETNGVYALNNLVKADTATYTLQVTPTGGNIAAQTYTVTDRKSVV